MDVERCIKAIAAAPDETVFGDGGALTDADRKGFRDGAIFVSKLDSLTMIANGFTWWNALNGWEFPPDWEVPGAPVRWKNYEGVLMHRDGDKVTFMPPVNQPAPSNGYWLCFGHGALEMLKSYIRTYSYDVRLAYANQWAVKLGYIDAFTMVDKKDDEGAEYERKIQREKRLQWFLVAWYEPHIPGLD